MELIVLNIGFDLGLIPQKVFTMLVIMAVLTTLMAGPLLKAVAVEGRPRHSLGCGGLREYAAPSCGTCHA
jgi:hypothetical protein